MELNERERVYTMNFKDFYNNLIGERGFRAAFIRAKIADHCSVSIHTVAGWCDGKPVREIYLKSLESFKI